jgi:hypothetical protein
MELKTKNAYVLPVEDIGGVSVAEDIGYDNNFTTTVILK